MCDGTNRMASGWQAGGPVYDIPKGRKDGRRSKIEDTFDLPSPFFNSSELAGTFGQHGFSIQEMVALSGNPLILWLNHIYLGRHISWFKPAQARLIGSRLELTMDRVRSGKFFLMKRLCQVNIFFKEIKKLSNITRPIYKRIDIFISPCNPFSKLSMSNCARVCLFRFK